MYPSGASSIHDRVCQIFYELVGGQVDYGEEHSRFHNHAQFGKIFSRGKYEVWSEENPIILVGHSFGGVTARALQAYLANSRFPGYAPIFCFID